MAKSYKYQCRECPPRTRRQCIQEAHISPGIKRIIEQAFEQRIDTPDTWDFLQPNCLLVRRDRVATAPPKVEKHALLDRIQEQRQKAATQESEKQELEEQEPEKEQEPPPVVRPPSATVSPREVALRSEAFEPPVGEVPARSRPDSSFLSPKDVRSQYQDKEATLVPRSHAKSALQPPSPAISPTLSIATAVQYPPALRPQPTQTQVPGPRMLVAQASGHRISLPENGELILGRFDPLATITPDVDLAFEDQWDQGVSRRHARITGYRGRYTIADLGSHNGTWVNGERLSLTAEWALQVGDEVRLGSCILFFDQVPALWNQPFPAGQYFVYVTSTGRFFPLPLKSTISLGRADPALRSEPDIDLSREGEIASVVSRRHARLIRDRDQFLIEDLGSANGTRVDGQLVLTGMRMPIRPGQHLCLGGCVLAFDVVEMFE